MLGNESIDEFSIHDVITVIRNAGSHGNCKIQMLQGYFLTSQQEHSLGTTDICATLFDCQRERFGG